MAQVLLHLLLVRVRSLRNLINLQAERDRDCDEADARLDYDHLLNALKRLRLLYSD